MKSADRLITNLSTALRDVDLVIINQQVLSGIHTGYLKKKLAEIIKEVPDKIFIADSRNFTDFYDGAYRKMNDTEASLLCGIKKDPDEIIPLSDSLLNAETLFERYEKPVFITRGSRGSLAVDGSGIIEIPGLSILSKIDTVGAGDSYLAGVAATLAAGYSLGTAAEIGSYVAGVTVRKLYRTGTASPAEILDTGSDPDLIYNPELAEDMRQAEYLDSTEIEIINRLPENLKIRHAIFDHDGTISTLREGWEHIMAPMMIKAILGDKFHEADEVIYHKIESRVHEFIDQTTGIQTLMQMKILLDIILEFGFVPDDKLLDEYGYKNIYNNALMEMVGVREHKYKNRELSIDDLTIKNSVHLLKKLSEAGVRLYLASGTDEDDVRNEAKALGYEHLFEGGIYGAVGDIRKDAKRIVLDRILDTIGDSGNEQVATFGDGPVEIRETRKRGGITIGVASDEIKRFGLNIKKRTRLIKAGADIVVPDFSQMNELLTLLKIR